MYRFCWNCEHFKSWRDKNHETIYGHCLNHKEIRSENHICDDFKFKKSKTNGSEKNKQ